MSNYSTCNIPNHRVGELRNNVTPASVYIKDRVDELKQDTNQLKDSLREMAGAIVRLDDTCFEEFGCFDQRLHRIKENIQSLMSVVEKQAQSAWEIQDLMEEMLDRVQEDRGDHHPTVHWALDLPNGEEPQGRGGSSSTSERQFDMNEDF